ncbi:RNA polymerase-like protein III subunit C17 [Lipomyces tetrasporus]
MKVENPRDKLISNYEVLDHIHDIKRRQKRSASKHRAIQRTENLETILLELQGYLKGTPAAKQTAEDLREFLQQISAYELEKAEKLQLINVAPGSEAALHSLIEECDQRFTDEERQHMVALVAQFLHPDGQSQ